MVTSDVETPLIPYLRLPLPLPSATSTEWAKKCSNFGMNPRLYDVHLILKPGRFGNKRRMFFFFGPPCSVALIKTDIKTTLAPMEDTYPTTAELKLAAALDFIPVSLRLLLQHLFVGKDTSRKVASIGQAVVQAVRSRVVMVPLQLGVAVQMHHVLITILD